MSQRRERNHTVKPGEVYQAATDTAFEYIRGQGLDPKRPASWRQAAEHFLAVEPNITEHRRAASVAYTYGAIAAGSLGDFALGEKFARLSMQVVAPFHRRDGAKTRHAVPGPRSWS